MNLPYIGRNMAPTANIPDHYRPPNGDSFLNIPPFPKNMKTAPLVRISLRNLVNGDPVEEDTLWKACCDLGFFYLDMRMGRIQGLSHTTSQVDEGTVDGDVLLEEADKLFDFMKDLFALLMEEKIKYDLKEKGIYFG